MDFMKERLALRPHSNMRSTLICTTGTPLECLHIRYVQESTRRLGRAILKVFAFVNIFCKNRPHRNLSHSRPRSIRSIFTIFVCNLNAFFFL